MERETFFKRLPKDSMSEDFKKLFENGTIDAIMKKEQQYKESGGYSELDSTIEEDSER